MQTIFKKFNPHPCLSKTANIVKYNIHLNHVNRQIFSKREKNTCMNDSHPSNGHDSSIVYSLDDFDYTPVEI